MNTEIITLEEAIDYIDEYYINEGFFDNVKSGISNIADKGKEVLKANPVAVHKRVKQSKKDREDIDYDEALANYYADNYDSIKDRLKAERDEKTQFGWFKARKKRIPHTRKTEVKYGLGFKYDRATRKAAKEDYKRQLKLMDDTMYKHDEDSIAARRQALDDFDAQTEDMKKYGKYYRNAAIGAGAAVGAGIAARHIIKKRKEKRRLAQIEARKQEIEARKQELLQKMNKAKGWRNRKLYNEYLQEYNKLEQMTQ